MPSILSMIRIALVFYFFAAGSLAFGHSDREDYVFVNINKANIEGEFHINVINAAEIMSIDPTGFSTLEDRSTVEAYPKLTTYIQEKFSIAPLQDDAYRLALQDPRLLREAGDFIVIPFESESAEIPRELAVRHQMFHDTDPGHRGLLLVQYVEQTGSDYGPEHTALIFGPGKESQVLDLENVPGLISRGSMLYQGVLHIWAGLDHILFLLALILPTVLVASGKELVPVQSFSRSFRNLLGVVTMFTIAHSITLFLAMLDLVSVNSQLVESVIALSIALAALNNIFRVVERGTLWIILFLGLFHGLGFASVMSDLPFRMENLAGMVIRFNIGVELGQVAIVAAVFPLLYLLRHRSFYQPWILKGGSWALVAISAFWFFERAMG